MSQINFYKIVAQAWNEYDDSRKVRTITDISAKVSTNSVYRIVLENNTTIIAKVSYFGTFDHFVEDHTIINVLSNNLPRPFENFLSRALMKGDSIYYYRYQKTNIDVWVVFYRPVHVKTRMPKRLNAEEISKMGRQMASFHRACTSVKNTLPPSSKSMKSDIQDLLDKLNSNDGSYEFGIAKDILVDHCESFLHFYESNDHSSIDIIPVFVDWNIGNFSVNSKMQFYSRWDYDWFRMSSRMADFYFCSRVVSDVGDRTIFTYNIEVLLEDRFIDFLKSYHSEFHLTAQEIDMLPEMYRFFLLNYVIKYGHIFFHELYANKLKKEVFEIHLPRIKEFKTDRLKSALSL